MKRMELTEIMRRRRSVRTYTEERIPEEKLRTVLQAGLLSASSRGIRPWEFIVVRDREMLKRMSACRAGSARMLARADAAIVVLGDELKSDVWTEDCSIAMANMHLMADSLGLGSCWIQGRLRETEEGESSEEYLRRLLGYPEHLRLEAVLSLGMPQSHPEGYDMKSLPADKIHREKY